MSRKAVILGALPFMDGPSYLKSATTCLELEAFAETFAFVYISSPEEKVPKTIRCQIHVMSSHSHLSRSEKP
jgi:hypothetical protein